MTFTDYTRRRRRLGKCADCGALAEHGRSRCKLCAERHRMRWHRKRYA